MTTPDRQGAAQPALGWHTLRRRAAGAVAGPTTIALLLGAIAFAVTCAGFTLVSPAILEVSTWDYWFESDVPGVYKSMIDRWGDDHWRTSHHPLFSIITFTPVFLLRLAGMGAGPAVAVVLAGITGLWTVAYFRFLWAAGLDLSRATVYTVLAGVTAAALFWFPVPEMYGLGALTMTLALLIVAVADRGERVSFPACVVVSALVLGASTSNWPVALLMLIVVLPRLRALGAAVLSFGLVYAGWRIQKEFFPGAAPFIQVGGMETNYLFSPLAYGPLAKTASFFFHSVVLPAPVEAFGSRLSVQTLAPGAGSLVSMVGVVLWAALLTVAGIGLFSRRPSRTLVVLGLAIGGQFALHVAFGIETFLYSLHFAPFLIAFAAIAAPVRMTRVTTVLAILLVLVAGWGNVRQYLGAADRIQRRYEGQRAFTIRVGELTDPGAPVIYGLRAAAAEGMPVPPPLRLGTPRRVGALRAYPGVQVERTGWEVYFEDWSLALVEQLRQAGAAYFVSDYAFGFTEVPAFLSTMGVRYVPLEVTPDWVIYRLEPPRP